jgi:hypothetical protein
VFCAIVEVVAQREKVLLGKGRMKLSWSGAMRTNSIRGAVHVFT